MLIDIYLHSLYIIGYSVMHYKENTILNDLCTLYIVTLYIRSEVFGGGGGQFKTNGNIAGTKSESKAGRVVYIAEAGIGIGGIEGLVEENDAVVAIEHQIADLDCAGLVSIGRKRRTQVMVFLIAVQFVHRDR